MSLVRLARFGAIGSMVLLLVACASSPNELAPTSPPQTSAGGGASTVNPATPAPTASSNSYKVGDRIKIGDEEYFTIVEVDPAVEPGEFLKPDKGNKWVAVLVEIEGINPEGATYNPFYFSIKDGNGFEYNFSAFGKEPSLQSGNDLAPGKKVRGWVTFEVPEDATGLVVSYEAGVFADAVEVELD